MTGARPIRREDARAFVRETLGCGCADEVLREIEVSGDLEIGGVPVACRLDVGHRLLVYVLAVAVAGEVEEGLGPAVRAGRAERDASGYNRLRLVLAVPDPALVADRAEVLFRALPDRDERVHLHVVAESEVAHLCKHS